MKTDKEKVLHIDDDPNFLELFQIKFSGRFSITMALGVDEALNYLDKQEFDVIVTDYEMPEKSGIDLLNELKGRDIDIPVIFCTGQGNEDIAREAFLCGVHDYFTKELYNFAHKEKLINSMEKAIRAHRSEREKREAIKAVYESEEKHRLLTEHSGMAIAVHDIILDESGKPVDYVFISANPAFETHTGLKVDDIIGKRVTQILPGIEDTPFIEKYGKVATTGNPIEFQQYSTPLNKYFNINAYQLSPGRFATVFYDITESIRAQEALRKSEKLHRELFDLIPDMISIHDPKMNIIYSNWNGFANVPQEKRTLNTKCYKTYRGLDEPCSDCHARTVLSSKEPFQREIKMSDGRLVDLRVLPVKNDKGEVEYFMEWLRDITEIKKTEETLKEQKELLQLLTNLATDFISIPVRKTDDAINRVLEMVGEHTKSDRAYIFQHDFSNKVTSNTHEWCQKGISPEIDNLRAVPFDTYKEILETHQRGEIYHIPRVSALPHSHPLRDHLMQQGIRSMVLFPLTGKDSYMGFAGFDSVKKEKSFSNTEIQLLTVLARIISNALEKKTTDEEMVRQNRLLKGIIDGIPDIIGVQSTDHTIAFYNSAGYSFFNKPPEEVVGKRCFELLGRDKECSICPTRLALDSGKIEQVEKFIPERNAYYYCRSNPITDGDGNILYLVEQLTDITRQKEIEQALRKSEAELRKITENISDVIFTTDLNFNLTYITPSIERLTGESIKSYLNKSLEEKYPPETLIKFREVLMEELEKENDPNADKNRSRIIEADEFKKDGTTVSIAMNIKFIRDENGTPIGLQGVSRDITQRKKAEIQLKESESRFLDVMYASQDAILLVENNIFVDCNEAAVKMLGYEKKEQFLNTHPADLSPAFQLDGRDSIEKTDEMMRLAFEEGFCQFEWVHRRAGGQDFLVEVSLTPLILRGKPVLYCVWRDLTKMKIIEKSIMLQHQLTTKLYSAFGLKNALEIVLDTLMLLESFDCGGIYVVDPKKERLDLVVHRGLSRDFIQIAKGYDRDHPQARLALKGEKIYGLYTDIMQELDPALKEEQLQAIAIVPIIHKNKVVAVINLSSHKNPDIVEYDKITLETIAGNIGPVISHLRIEEELIKKNQELNDFAHKVSHGLKGPLNNMMGFLNLIQQKPELFVKYFERLMSNANRLMQLIDNILKLARSGLTIGEKKKINIENILLRLKQQYSSGDTTFDMDLHCPGLSIMGDSVGIEQVFQNLVDNSVKYRDTEKSVLKISVSSHISGKDLIFTYTDNGSGLDTDNQDIIFSPGYTLSRDRGTGFGLAITRQIVNAHQGSIIVSSEGKNKGIKFTIKLPQETSQCDVS